MKRFIKLKHPLLNEPVEAIVVGCSLDKGITIVNAEDTEEIEFCGTPGMPQWKEVYKVVSEMIEEGYVDAMRMARALGEEDEVQIDKMGIDLGIIPSNALGTTQADLHERCPYK